MKVYARQVEPDFQDTSWLLEDDFLKENIVLIKNRDFPAYVNHVDEFNRAVDSSKYYYWENWDSVKILFQLYTGKRWEPITIRGYNQGEWQYCLFCSDVISREEIHVFEAYYFNTGTEYEILGNSDGETDSSIYCISLNHKKEIARVYNVEEKDVVIYEFVGYKKTPQYKLV